MALIFRSINPDGDQVQTPTPQRTTVRIQPSGADRQAPRPPHWPFGPLTPLQLQRRAAQEDALRQAGVWR